MRKERLQHKQLGIVHFDSEPRGAEIIVDGQVLVNSETEESIKTPATVELLEGRRDFIMRLEGSEDATGYVDVLAGTTVNIFRNINPGTPGGGEQPQPQISLMFSATNAADHIFLTAPDTGVLMIYSFPDGADTYVNGRHVGKTPLIVIDVPAGVATVTWQMGGMMNEEKIVDIVEGAQSQTFATMRPALPKLSPYYQNMDYQINEGEIMNTTQYNDTFSADHYTTQGSAGNATVTSCPEEATICIDGSIIVDDLGKPITTPVTITLLEGYHTIALELDGYYTGYEYVYIYPGAELNTSTSLAKKMYNDTFSNKVETMQENCIKSFDQINLTNVLGNTVITTYPTGAKMYIDGSLIVDAATNEPITTPADICMYMGYHDLRFTLEGFYDEFWGVYTIPGDMQFVHRYFNVARSC